MNKKALAAVVSIFLAVIALVATSRAQAESSVKDAAVQSYKAKRYSEAAAQFQTAVNANPKDEASHYWLALSYQQLRQMAQAQKEYEWVVANATDKGLKAQAQQGLNNLSRLGGGKTVAGTTPTAAVASSTSVGGPKPKVIEFSATWCGPCKRFAPTFEKVSNMFTGKIDVQKIDIDDKATQDITNKYNVQAVPTIVFLDGKGNVVNTHQGGMDEQELQSTMQSLVGR